MEGVRKSLTEEIEELIQDLFKNKTIKELESVLEFLKINRKSITNNKEIPFQLSLKLITFIKDNVISVEKTINIFKIYIDEFFNLKYFPEDEIDNFKKIITSIFIIESKVYTSIGFKDFLNNFFKKYYPKNTNIKHKEGDIMDVLIADEDSFKTIIGWTQLPIKQVDEEKKIYIFENPFIKERKLEAKFDSYQVQERNTFITEEEVNWKKNLKINDVVDFYYSDKGMWGKGYIQEIGDSTYKIKSIFDPEIAPNMKIVVNYSPLIQPLFKFSFKYDKEDKACFYKEITVENYNPYGYFLSVTKNNYTVPCEGVKNLSLEYYDIVNYFIIKLLSLNVLQDESISIMYLNSILETINYFRHVLNMRYISKYIKENWFEHLKNVFYKFSLSKQKIININLGWKFIIEKTLSFLDLFLGYNDYLFNRFYYVPELYIKFGYNCFKSSDNLEKRHLGLTAINAIFPFLKTYYPIIGKKAINQMTEFINETLLNIDNKDDIITLLYSQLSIHEELLIKGKDIILNISDLKLLTDKHIEHLFNLAFASPENSELNKFVYDLLNKIITNFSLNQKEIIFNKIINLQYDKIRKCDIELVKNILKNITSKENFLSMAQSFLNYYYKYIIEFHNFDTGYNEDFGEIISYSKDFDNLIFLYKLYFKQFLEETKKQNDLEKYRFYFTLIHSIFNSFYYLDNKINNISLIKEELKKLFLEQYSYIDIIVDKSIELYNNEKNEQDENYLKDVIDIVFDFLDIIGDNNYLTIDVFLKLADFFIFGDKSKKNRIYFINTLLNIKKYKLDLFKLYEKLFEKIDNYLDKVNLDNSDEYLDTELISAICNLYENINNKNTEIKTKSTMELFNIKRDKYLGKRNPLENKYFEIIWKMFYKSKNTDKIENFLQDFSLKNFTTKERFEIWEKLIKKIFSNLENNILVGLTMLKFIIKISEKYGNAQVKSHICDLYSKEYKKKFDLKFKSNTRYFNDINLKLSLNKKSLNNLQLIFTIYDIKYMLEEFLGYDPIIQKICVNNIGEIKDDSLPLYKIFPKLLNTNEFQILVNLERDDIALNTPCYPLLTEDNNELSDKFIEVIFKIFYKYSENDILSSLNFAKFFKDIYEPFDKTQIELESIFIEAYKIYSNNKDYLNIDDFLLYFAKMAQDDIELTYQFLINLGFTKSLDYYLDKFEKDNILYYEKNTKKEYLPRYFVGNNLEYIKIIFNLLKTEDETIYNLAKDIIYELSTPEIFKQILFESKDENKINELLFDDNLELKVYMYNIIITIFNDDVNSVHNLVQNFNNNYLEKIINEFIKINLNNKDNIINNEKNPNLSNSLSFKKNISYFSSTIRLLLLCFKNIVDQKILDDYIENFIENKNIDIKSLEFKLNENNQNLIKKIDFQKLLNTILDNLKMINEAGKINELKILNSIKLMIYILLLISNYFEENKKEKIYQNFFEKQMIILCNSTSYKLSNNIFIMNKLLSTLINEEKNQIFLKSQNEEICKILKDYKKLNSSKGDKTYLFDLFQYLYDIFKYINNDEIFDLFKYILSIILDKNIIIQKNIIGGYLEIINKIINILKNNKYEKIFNYNFDNLIFKFISEYLITFEKDKNILIKELNNIDDSYFIIMPIYKILSSIIEINPEKYILTIFDNENIKNLTQKHLTKLEGDKINYFPEEEMFNSYVGLYNPSALCYINSVIQQFYNIILFRNTILSIPLEKNLNPDLDNDNFFFQFQKMFYNLKYSIKKYYNPKSFVFSFKDSQGKSPDINEQCDAQEFLLKLIEKINDSLKNTKNKYLCENIFGGNTLQQIKCTNPECGNISERRDDINYLSLEIKNKHNLKDCLNGFIEEEKVEDYLCEKCHQKITHTKQVLIDQIPNILIIHLQRFVFDYNNFTMKKLNTPVTFEETLNIKNFTIEKDNNNLPLEYFEYELQGTLIHSGEHQYGHYYSLIYNKEKKNFYEFNDVNITEIDYDKGIKLSFGQFGDIKNAYMLIYKKKIKNPIIINHKPIDENLKSILEKNNNVDKIETNEGKIYYVYENEKDVIKNNIKFNIGIKNIIIKNDKSESELIQYDDALNLLTKENSNSYESKPFIDKILLENIKLKNDSKFYNEDFINFINEITVQIANEIIKGEKIDKYINALKLLNDFVINIISISREKELLPKIINNLLVIFEKSKNKELLNYLLQYIENIKENIFNNYLVSKDRIKGKEIGKYIAKIICISINNNIEIELGKNIIKYFIDKIPIEITKKWLFMNSFNDFIFQLVEGSDIIKEYFIKKNMISKLMDFILGKKSPLYKGDERDEFKNTKGYFEPIVKSIALLFKYYEINISNKDLILSSDDISLIIYNNFYDKIVEDNYGESATELLLDNKICLIMELNIKENKPINDEDIIDYIINKKIEKIVTKEKLVTYLELLINLLKKYSLLYLNKNNDIFIEKLNIIFGLPLPTVNSGKAEIKYISGKYYDKYTILTNISKEEKISKDNIKVFYLLFDLLNNNELIFNYIDNLPAHNSFKFSYADYLLKLYLDNKEELEKIENDKDSINKLSELYNDIIKKYNKNNLDNVSLDDKLYFSDFGYDLKNNEINENIKIYEINIKYEILTEHKKTDLECFNDATFFSNLNNINKKEANEELSHLDNLFCLLVFCNDDLDIIIEFKPYFNSVLEIKAKKNNHYIFYCLKDNKTIDYSKMKISTKARMQPIHQQHIENQIGNNYDSMKNELNFPKNFFLSVKCEVCGTNNLITNFNAEFKCSFCECPLNISLVMINYLNK